MYAVSASNEATLVCKKKSPNIQTHSAKSAWKESCAGRSKPDTALPIYFAEYVPQNDCSATYQNNALKKYTRKNKRLAHIFQSISYGFRSLEAI